MIPFVIIDERPIEIRARADLARTHGNKRSQGEWFDIRAHVKARQLALRTVVQMQESHPDQITPNRNRTPDSRRETAPKASRMPGVTSHWAVGIAKQLDFNWEKKAEGKTPARPNEVGPGRTTVPELAIQPSRPNLKLPDAEHHTADPASATEPTDGLSRDTAAHTSGATGEGQRRNAGVKPGSPGQAADAHPLDTPPGLEQDSHMTGKTATERREDATLGRGNGHAEASHYENPDTPPAPRDRTDAR